MAALEMEVEFDIYVVERFIDQFMIAIFDAPDNVKKLLLKKCISEVIVDREVNRFQFQIRKVPAVTPELEKKFKLRVAPYSYPCIYTNFVS